MFLWKIINKYSFPLEYRRNIISYLLRDTRTDLNCSHRKQERACSILSWSKTFWLLFNGHLLERFRCFPIRGTFTDLRRRLNIFIQSVCGSRFGTSGTRSGTTFVPVPEGDSFTEMQSGSFPIAIHAIRRPRTLNKIQFSTWGPFRESSIFVSNWF